MKKIAKIFACIMAVSVILSMVCIPSFATEEDGIGNVIYEQNFNDIADGSLPEGFTLSETLAAASGTAEVQKGELVVTATNADLGKVMLPSNITAANFIMECDVAFKATRDANRYATIVFRQQEKNEEYYHMCYRFTANGANGCEIACRNPGTWTVLNRGSADVVLSYGDYSHIKIVVYDDMIYEYVNDELVVQGSLENLETMWTSGAFAIGCNFSTCVFDNLKITEITKNIVEPNREKEQKEITAPCESYLIMKGDIAEIMVEDQGGNQVEASIAENGNLLLTVESGAADPQFSINFDNFGRGDEVSIADYPVMAIRARFVTEPYAAGAQCYFYTTTSMNASAEVVLTYNYKQDSDFHTYAMDGRACAKLMELAEEDDCWNGMRFDVVAATNGNPVTIEVEWIAFFKNLASAYAFDGDFSALPTATPTAEPTDTPVPTDTPAPTDTPKPTDEPTEAPATDAP